MGQDEGNCVTQCRDNKGGIMEDNKGATAIIKSHDEGCPIKRMRRRSK